MQDWFERDVKLPGVILHDKLMSDALLGTLPIKTEHSYSLNSDGDSMPESPGSLKNKMDDMEDECYPAISMNTATSNSRRLIDPAHLTTTHINPAEISLNNCAVLTNNHNNSNNSNNNNNSNTINSNNSNNNSNNNSSSTCHLTILNSCSTNTISINPNSLQNTLNPLAINIRPKHVTDQLYSGNSSSTSSLSDIDIDDSCIKDEPMSPADSSCPPSPLSVNATTYLTNITSPFTNTTNIIQLEHKNRSIQLTPASQSLLKAQQITLGNGISATLSGTNTNSLTSSPQRLVIPKVNIKIESPTTTTVTTQQQLQQQQQQQHLFGLPPTPPSSLPSDESEGNQSPEHHLLSPMSPPMQQQLISSSSSSSSTNSSPAASPSTSTTRRNHNNSGQTTSGVATSSHHNNNSNNASNSGRGYTGTSTRQPIHTPLISSQPKGSTGTLVLTEEEKRTLLAEGYPIPTRLPLTKAEEKSLKKIRRKIKNKISAQESRRKKKEYMDQLERKVEILVSENTDYKKRVESLEESNANLLTQLAKLQSLLNRQKKSN
ncbi:cyclic AMP response element-binding protein A [Condylostylus longicornis]|uniref:cyclic AMP response element-binding protein A n=1 Tax=Condylostylus longicornis TaxID=2530218 RepID=UPI00244DF812|nr:cyclic AMP response element-binding protein A [Condylostylus longicornis]